MRFYEYLQQQYASYVLARYIPNMRARDVVGPLFYGALVFLLIDRLFHALSPLGFMTRVSNFGKFSGKPPFPELRQLRE
jgi:hypothetical protein